MVRNAVFAIIILILILSGCNSGNSLGVRASERSDGNIVVNYDTSLDGGDKDCIAVGQMILVDYTMQASNGYILEYPLGNERYILDRYDPGLDSVFLRSAFGDIPLTRGQPMQREMEVHAKSPSGEPVLFGRDVSFFRFSGVSGDNPGWLCFAQIGNSFNLIAK